MHKAACAPSTHAMFIARVAASRLAQWYVRPWRLHIVCVSFHTFLPQLQHCTRISTMRSDTFCVIVQALDRWEQRLEAIFSGHPYDNLDAALTDTVNKFPVEIQPFRDMIDGMRSDLAKTRYKTYDELYKYCYQVAGTVALMVMPVMGMDPKYKVRTCSLAAKVHAIGCTLTLADSPISCHCKVSLLSRLQGLSIMHRSWHASHQGAELHACEYHCNTLCMLQGSLEPVYRAALALGTANQLTNILRDVGEDIRERNRIYVPLDELARFNISEADLVGGMHSTTTGAMDDRWVQFMKYMVRKVAYCRLVVACAWLRPAACSNRRVWSFDKWQSCVLSSPVPMYVCAV